MMPTCMNMKAAATSLQHHTSVKTSGVSEARLNVPLEQEAAHIRLRAGRITLERWSYGVDVWSSVGRCLGIAKGELVDLAIEVASPAVRS